MNAYSPPLRQAARWLALALVGCGWLMTLRAGAGNWVTVASPPPNNHGIGMMLLLSDGTVMCSASDDTNNLGLWFRLTPDQYGSYVNGSWTSLAHAGYSRLYYTSDMLSNGTVFVAGGEYGSGKFIIQTYDPVANAWSQLHPPTNLYNTNLGDYFADTISAVVPNGSVLMSPALNNPGLGNEALLYNPGANVWTNTSMLAQGVTSQGEDTWTKLPDGSILTVDGTLTGNPPHTSERYIPALNQWIADAKLPVSLWNIVQPPKGGGSCEIGPGLLLPNGQAFYAGGNGWYGLYTPSGSTNAGSWAAYMITNGLESADMPGSIMANGKVLLILANNCTDVGCLGQPYYFYEYDYTVNSPVGAFLPVTAPTNQFGGTVPFMLNLPDGTVLVSSGGTAQLMVYQPSGSPVASGKPVITSITPNADNSFHLVGTGLNGISEGSSFGDDGQMASDYPVIRLTNPSSGQVYYARTYNWSSFAIGTGNQPEATEFTLPSNLPPGPYSLVVTANGIASDPVTFFGPVYVNFNATSDFQFGTYEYPYGTLAEGTNAVASGGTIALIGSTQPSVSTQAIKIAKPMTLIAVKGPSTIGQ